MTLDGSKPNAKKWQNAELWELSLYNNKWPVCGQRMVWCMVGTKMVYCCTPFLHQKFKMRRKEWNEMTGKERYHTDEDKKIYREKREKIWADAEEHRKLVAAGVKVKSTRRRKRRTLKTL